MEIVKCKGKHNTDKSNVVGWLYHSERIGGIDWGLVMWDGETEPSLYKTSHLLVAETKWVQATRNQ